MKEELYVKDDKRVLIVGGGTHYGKSYAMEMILFNNYKESDANFLTYSDNMPRIEPSKLLMNLIGRI